MVECVLPAPHMQLHELAHDVGRIGCHRQAVNRADLGGGVTAAVAGMAEVRWVLPQYNYEPTPDRLQRGPVQLGSPYAVPQWGVTRQRHARTPVLLPKPCACHDFTEHLCCIKAEWR